MSFSEFDSEGLWGGLSNVVIRKYINGPKGRHRSSVRLIYPIFRTAGHEHLWQCRGDDQQLPPGQSARLAGNQPWANRDV
jgi:hypothetical protein